MKPEQIFLNDLYTIRSTHSESVNKLTVQVSINREHLIFTGHFPGNPILPGVATIQILKELISAHLGCSVRLVRAGNIKYLFFINPEKHSLVDFEIDLKDTENGNISCNSSIHSGQTVFCTFKGEFSKGI
jgi:3-hydroxyacyl-[acyl-carrier-protein] dehydratase